MACRLAGVKLLSKPMLECCRPLVTNFSEILIKVHTFSFNKTHLKMMLYAKWQPFCLCLSVLTHWGRRQAIIWTNAGILLIGPLGTNSSEILIGIRTFWFKKMRLKMSSGKWRPSCLGFNVLMMPRWHHMSRNSPSWFKLIKWNCAAISGCRVSSAITLIFKSLNLLKLSDVYICQWIGS